MKIMKYGPLNWQKNPFKLFLETEFQNGQYLAKWPVCKLRLYET